MARVMDSSNARFLLFWCFRGSCAYAVRFDCCGLGPMAEGCGDLALMPWGWGGLQSY